MALPVVAGVSIIAIITAIAQFVQATFSVINTALTAVVQWFAAHKILFGLFLLGVWLALWFGVVSLVSSVASWALASQLGSNPDYAPIREGLTYLNSYVPVNRIGHLITLTLSLFSAEVLIRNTRWGFFVARRFVSGVSSMFHG